MAEYISVTGVSLNHEGKSPRSYIRASATPSEQTIPTGEHISGPIASTSADRTGAWTLKLVRAPGLSYAITDATEVRLLVCDQTLGDRVEWSDLPVGVPPEQMETEPILGIGSVVSDGEGGMTITLTDGRVFTMPLERGPKGDPGLSILPDPNRPGLYTMSGTPLMHDANADGLYLIGA